MTLHVDILTLFPGYFDSPLRESLVGRAIDAQLLSTTIINIRDFATDKHKKADDEPFGGGAGMVMKPEPLVGAIEFASQANPTTEVIFLTPQGEPLTHQLAAELAQKPALTFVCGHYEGIDQRVRDGWVDREISIGDFVLTGGEPAAIVLLDAVARLIPGVLGNPESLTSESFTDGALDYPQYTRPRSFRGHDVPAVLVSGNHKAIDEWREQMSAEKTAARRPDLLDQKD